VSGSITAGGSSYTLTVASASARPFSPGSSAAAARALWPPQPFLPRLSRPVRRLASTVTGSITAGGQAVTLSLPSAGDTGELTFNGVPGERLFVKFTDITIGSGCFQTVDVAVKSSAGATITSKSWLCTGGDYLETFNLPQVSDSYTIQITPVGNKTGSITTTLYDVLADPSPTLSPSTVGDSTTFATATPGQNAAPTFTGTQGERVFVHFTSNTISTDCLNTVDAWIDGPGGNVAPRVDLCQIPSGDYLETVTLPSNGTYTLTINPEGALTGSVTATVYQVPADVTGTLAIGGQSQNLTIATPGQGGLLTFNGGQGQPVRIAFTNNTIASSCLYGLRASIRDPNGATVVGPSTMCINGDSLNATLPLNAMLPMNGLYSVVLDPYGALTGGVTVTATVTAPYVATTQTYGTCGKPGAHALSVSECLADPVNSLTGAFTDSETDLSLPATGVSFAFTRSYTSADSTVGRLGPGWTDNYAASLAVQPNGDVLVHGDEGQQVYYAKQADGSFVGADGALSTLSAITGGYKLVRHDQVSYQFDANGALLSELDRNGQGLSFTYDGSGRLTTITDSASHAVTVAYNASNLISSVSTPDGRVVAYGYTSGRLTSVTLPDPDGAGPLAAPVWTYTYDANGRLWQEIDPNAHTQVTNVYDPSTGRVTQQTDANQKTTLFAWDAPTQTATITDPDNHVWKDVYQNNVLIKRIDPAGEVTQFGHDIGLDTNLVTSPNGTDATSMSYVSGNLMTATAPVSLGVGVKKSFTYDTQNNVKTVTDARNKLSQYGYDTAGNNNSITLDGQQVFGATYNAQGQMLTSTDGNGNQTTYTYDASGNVASVTTPDPDGAGPLAASKTTYTYDAMGNVLTRVDPLGNCSGCTPANYTTTYTYDTNGHLLTEIDPLGHTTTHTYDAAGNQTTVTDANNHTTTYGYDSANHLLQVTGADPDGSGPLEASITKYSYDDAGNRLTMIGPRGNCSGCASATYTTTYTYDQNNRLASVTTAKGETTTYSYDTSGNLASMVDPRGNVQGANPADYKTSYSYDAAGRLLTTTDPLAHVTTNHYDPVGNLDWTKDANLHQTSNTYDAAGQILTVTAPDSGLTTYTYDGNGNLQTRKDDNSHVTSYSYDGAGRLTQTTGPDPDGAGPLTSPLTTRTYDANGNLASTTDPNGNATQTAGDGTTTYTYDHANRPSGISYSDSTPPVGYGYDNVGNRTSMSDSSGSVTYVYDNLDRLTSATRGTNTFSYAYDVAGNVSSRTYPDTTQTSYAYDEDNRLASATTSGTTTSYSYDPASHLAQTTLPSGNGYLETRNYDHAGRLTEVKNAKGASLLSDFVSTLDPNGNPTQIVQTGASPATQTYGYDTNNRILSVCFQAGTCPGASDPKISWSYDKVGNRLTETRPTTSTTDSYNAVDELTRASTQNTGTNPYSNQVVADGAQPYWRLGETSGTSFASTVGTFVGTWSGSPTLGAPGALNGDTNTAVTLNGAGQSTQYGTVANATGLNKTNNFALELWVKRSSARSGVLQAIAGKPLTTATKSENYALWLTTANKPQFEVGAGTGTKSAVVTSSTAISDTTAWHHVVGTFASGVLKIYLDGNLVGTNSAAGFTSVVTSTSTFDVGRSATTNYFSGTIDEIAVYGSALTASQISDHYNKGNNTPAIVSYGYDNNGNQIGAGTATLTYDLGNRLKTYASAGTTTTYIYDGDSNRLQASTGSLASQKTNYLWDTNQPLAQLALERDGNNSLIRRYTYGAGRISMTSGGNVYYYQYDPLGSVVNLTNSTGTTEWTGSYEPYGAVHSQTNNDPNVPVNPFKFSAEYSDPTGLYYLRARQYDSSIGRFDQVDSAPSPLGQPDTSAYAYAGDQPTVMVDPSGMTFVPASAGLVAAAMTSSSDDGDSAPMSAGGNGNRSLQSVCVSLGCKILRDPNISVWSGERSNIVHDLLTPGAIHIAVKRGLLEIAKQWKLLITILRSGHSNDGPHGHFGGWAVDIGNYTVSNYSTTTKFMIWLNRNRGRLVIRQIIGANEAWVYPHYYDRATLLEHKNHVHIGFGVWQ
jgi:RHS repeat-associated protein